MKKMTNSEVKMLEVIVEECQTIEKNCGMERAWDYLIDLIYDMDIEDDTHTLEFWRKLWDLDDEYKEKIVKAHIEETLNDI